MQENGWLKENDMAETMNDNVEIRAASGEVMDISLTSDEERAYSCLTVNGVRYHFERVTKTELMTQYKVDADPELPASN